MSAPTYELGKLHGGLRLDSNKAASTSMAIRDVPVPPQLVLPLAQHVGMPAHPVVSVGENVLKGQLVAEQEGALGAPVHASSSGTVVAIEAWPIVRRYGDRAPCIVIETDGEDRAVEPPAAKPFRESTPEELAARILAGGIVGLGGAAFPTAQKLVQANTCRLDYLLLNGVECEPYISCDDMLMRERADAVVSGGQVLLHVLGIDVCFIAVESDKPEALRALKAAVAAAGDPRIVTKQVPTIYPSGGEDQLVQLVTNREVPSGG
ncbi:MAG TPA: RnfABCDGE type electron transport complex subunit C, partial [Woeseiaceae bacterium]|nr:RnfABCDGE type electron transport complex subunit C [Woeseiaceae bacterium]